MKFVLTPLLVLIPFLTPLLVSKANASTLAYSLFSVEEEPPEGLASDTEAGMTMNKGNTVSDKYTLRSQNSYRWPEETIQLVGRFIEASAKKVESESSWGVGTRYQRRLVPRLSAFAGQLLEADRFSGYYQRYATDLGLRKTLWKSDKSVGALEFGGRYQYENRISGEVVIGHLLRVYGESSYQFHPILLGVASIEALPNFRNQTDWMLNSVFSLKTTVTKMFSFKTIYTLRYDHLPAGPRLHRLDTEFVTALVAQFR